MPSIIGKCKLFRIKHISPLLEGETFLRNKHEIVFFEIKCTLFLVEKKTPLLFDPNEHIKRDTQPILLYLTKGRGYILFLKQNP